MTLRMSEGPSVANTVDRLIAISKAQGDKEGLTAQQVVRLNIPVVDLVQRKLCGVTPGPHYLLFITEAGRQYLADFSAGTL